MKVNVLEELELFNASEEGYVLGSPYLTSPPQGLSVGTGGSFAYLDPGVYTLEEVEVDTILWYMIPGTVWGAYEETWSEYTDDGACEFIEEEEENPKRIPFVTYIQREFGRELHEVLERGRVSRISLNHETKRISEQIYMKSTGEILNERTLGYIPVNAELEMGMLIFKEENGDSK